MELPLVALVFGFAMCVWLYLRYAGRDRVIFGTGAAISIYAVVIGIKILRHKTDQHQELLSPWTLVAMGVVFVGGGLADWLALGERTGRELESIVLAAAAFVLAWRRFRHSSDAGKAP